VSTIDRFEDESFDLVLVDGRARVAAVRHAMPKVRPGGLLVLDDAERPRYREAIVSLDGWTRRCFTGPGGVSPNYWQTDVYLKPDPSGPASCGGRKGSEEVAATDR
jgi:hypothetical protein